MTPLAATPAVLVAKRKQPRPDYRHGFAGGSGAI
jgi:hypothetical protein